MKQTLIYLKVVLVPFILWGIFSALLSKDNIQSFYQANALVVVAVFINQIGLIFYALRLKKLALIYRGPLGLVESLKIHLQSIFYQVFIPSTAGMEVARFAKIKLLYPEISNKSLVAALLSDRAWSLLATLLTVGILSPFFIKKFIVVNYQQSYIPWTIGVSIVILIAVGIHPQVRSKISKVCSLLLEQKPHALRLGILSLLAHVFSLVAVCMLLRSLDLNISLGECLFGVSLSMLFLIVPVAILGITLSDGAAIVMFTILGYSAEHAALVASCVYVLRMLGALQGGVWEFIEDGYKIKMYRKTL